MGWEGKGEKRGYQEAEKTFGCNRCVHHHEYHRSINKHYQILYFKYMSLLYANYTSILLLKTKHTHTTYFPQTIK